MNNNVYGYLAYVGGIKKHCTFKASAFGWMKYFDHYDWGNVCEATIILDNGEVKTVWFGANPKTIDIRPLACRIEDGLLVVNLVRLDFYTNSYEAASILAVEQSFTYDSNTLDYVHPALYSDKYTYEELRSLLR